jgi:DNA helicase-2/ATP-dependent DNA helicase PcrA
MKQFTTTAPPAHQPLKIDYRRELNAEQLEVVMSDASPLLVIAGAGSGKTRTLTYRVARLIESGTPPGAILLLTFTNKAAKEMLGRVEGLINLNIAMLWGGTFHHVANRILRSRAGLIGYDSSFTILDRDDSRDLLNSCMADLGLKGKDRRFPQSAVIQEMISLSVNTRAGLPDLIDGRYPFFLDATDAIQSVAIHYRKRKQKEMLMDFDDLLLN